MAIRLSDQQVVQATGANRTRLGARASYEAVCTDSRQVIPGCLFVALEGDKFDAHAFVQQAVEAGAAGLVVKAGKKLALIDPNCALYEVPDTLRALGALARFHRQRFKVPIGAVTGSNGKTTTKELVGAILATRGPVLKTQGNLNNEVGVPLTLFGLEPRHVAAIVEMGMNHPGEIARLTAIARPDAGLITVVQPAHLEGCGSLDGVAKAKGELFHGLSAEGTAVVNLDDARVAAQARGIAAKTLTFGRAPDAQVRLAKVEQHGRDGLAIRIEYRGKEYPVALRLVGDHNALNAAGAFALATALGYSPEECVRGLEAAQAHARRLEIVDAPQGVTVVDDCYNANPASMTAALSTLTQLAAEGRAVAVLGDMLELGAGEGPEHARMGVTASDHAAVVAFFGPRMKTAHAEAAKKLGGDAAHFEDVAALLAWLGLKLRQGDVVLVKASRGMRLERVVEALTGHASGKGH
ncbi:MAG: UDP-N-acetylmuramoyl-tripeptide--D-alanyl-D-alanine ligase [Myxococcaceae bacterium]